MTGTYSVKVLLSTYGFLYGWPISVRAQRDKNGARTLGGSSGRNRKNCWRFPEIVYLCPATFRWLSPDPLAEDYYGLSPYGFCAGNPVNFVDYSGLHPVYSTDGELLGTDNEGLQGDAIIMNKEDFTQGMTAEDALQNDLGQDALSGDEAVKAFTASYSGLSSRPDWDGYLTLSETRDWYRNGNGAPLYVSSSLISLSSISVDGPNYYNLFTFIPVARNCVTVPQEGLVYGNIHITPLSTNEALLGDLTTKRLDLYDFDIIEAKTLNEHLRNFFTRIGKFYHGKGQEFEIYTYGTAKIN